MAAKTPINMSPDPNRAPGGARQLSANHPDAKKHLWSGRILHVDTETMCCSISLATAPGEVHDVPLPATGGGGPRSWAGSVPEPGTSVVVAWKQVGSRTFQPVIVQILTSGVYSAREYEPFSTVPPEWSSEALGLYPELADDPHYNLDILRLKLRKMYPGDFLASSSGGADILVDRDISLSNRSGNEIVLRDSDQTTVHQTINEFTSNAAGYYRRGLIKRNAFSFMQDLFPLNEHTLGAAPYDLDPVELFNQKVPSTSPAFTTLRDFGLIDETGIKTFNVTDGLAEYPYIVTSDGQRINYVTSGENTNGFDSWPHAYIEDRKELRHVSNGIMAVTEEGDGFQLDGEKEVFIEDVHGTVVGNDFSTDAGRKLYKKILKMKLFSDPGQMDPSPGPVFEALDNVQDQHLLDSKALARLYRIQAPESSNQFAFGIDKEGRTFVHIPASQAGDTPDEKGRSLDLNIAGLVKAIIGKDPNTQLSLDLVLNGGLNIEFGRGPKGNSNTFTMYGPIYRNIVGDNTQDGTPSENVSVGGSSSKTVSGSDFTYVRGTVARVSGASDTTEADSIMHNAGSGGYKMLVSGDHGITCLGKSKEMYADQKSSKFALGCEKVVVAGADDNTIIAGNYTRTVYAGQITDSVTTGNISLNTATGNLSASVITGSIGITVGTGSLALSCAGGPTSISSSVTTTITSGVSTVINSPTTKIGASVAGFAVAGVVGPPGPHIDYVTGLPILGIPTMVIG
jgi:hypothetical protein